MAEHQTPSTPSPFTHEVAELVTNHLNATTSKIGDMVVSHVKRVLKKMAKSPEIVKASLVKSHEVCLHSFSRVSCAQAKADKQIQEVESSLADLKGTVANFTSEKQLRTFSQPKTLSHSAVPLDSSTFDENNLAAMIKLAKISQTRNLSSLVLFDARAHLKGLSPQAFAEQAVGQFGKNVRVIETRWIGQAQNHLRVHLDKPQAEEIGMAFWRKGTPKVKFGLAPRRAVPLLRDSTSRMRRIVRILRDQRPDLRCRRESATCSSSFIGSHYFCAYDLLYQSLRLSDGSLISISKLIDLPGALPQ
jgi:hypothetical protein